MVGRVMRPAIEHGKEVGIILDNAGLWQEHHLSTIERRWSLKPRKIEGNKRVLYADVYVDNNGIVREVERQIPKEMQGLYATYPKEVKRLTYFETILTNVIKTRYKLLSAYRKYEEFVEQGGNKISKVEFEYVKDKLTSLNNLVEPDRAINPWFWHYEEKRIAQQNID